MPNAFLRPRQACSRSELLSHLPPGLSDWSLQLTSPHGKQGSLQSLSSFTPGPGSSSEMRCMGLEEIFAHPHSQQHYSQ